MMTSHANTAFAPSFGRNDVQVLAGSFDDFSFAEVVQVMGLSRQCLRFLVRQGGTVWSEILVKAGRVLLARAGSDGEPQQVFRVLARATVKGSGLAFAVFHIEPTGPYPEPVGELAQLCEAASGAASSSGAVSAAIPMPAASPLGPRTDGGTLIMERPPMAQPAPRPIAAPMIASVVAPMAAPLAMPMVAPVASVAVPLNVPPAATSGMEWYSVLAQRLDQVAGQMHALDARVNAMPQLLNAEMRLALAQHAPAPTVQMPAPVVPVAPVAVAPAPAESNRLPAAWLGAFAGVLAAVCIVLLVLLLQRVR